tara:strand:- start:592 stop:747 length:156 start_codon:yes stop_codon:yes gene_type:complete
MEYCLPDTNYCVKGWMFILAVVLEVLFYTTIAFIMGKKLKRRIKKSLKIKN